ncbi:MCP four helix bundle domain-containing protein [Catalinimonas niigatensis]|uniref:MCP four helix bundle domain-containing protein n=1 Tax=Catalinimonas niigatensis TaxID=1397264 RepID=UPI0026659321|nr:MCP four helix bundle domain-containing protein [Catalinimonas niigatensis]WPP50719.1 MCP four helix bundle domain-containing protein [Catalinimonas niigatensis]
MKSLYNIKHHLKIALGLTVVLICIILTSLVEKENLNTLDQSFSSIYADRLIPATDIFYISDHLYEKRLKVQSLLLSVESETQASDVQDLKRQNKAVDSLLAKYRETYLVENESTCLEDLTQKWEAYKSHEENVLNLAMNSQKTEAYDLFKTRGNDIFRVIITDLHKLTSIQSKVGTDLMNTSKSSIASTHLMFVLQVGVVIIIALIVNAILLTSKVIRRSDQNFHLN